MNLQVPTTKKQVKQVLGFFGYYRQYVKDFASLAKPLTDLTSKNLSENITWTEREQNSFDALKTAIKQEVILYAFEIGTCFSLYCDSSDWAVDAVLTQGDSQGVDRPISFISQKLN